MNNLNILGLLPLEILDNIFKDAERLEKEEKIEKRAKRAYIRVIKELEDLEYEREGEEYPESLLNVIHFYSLSINDKKNLEGDFKRLNYRRVFSYFNFLKDCKPFYNEIKRIHF